MLFRVESVIVFSPETVDSGPTHIGGQCYGVVAASSKEEAYKKLDLVKVRRGSYIRRKDAGKLKKVTSPLPADTEIFHLFEIKLLTQAL